MKDIRYYDYIDNKSGRHVVKAVTLYRGKSVCAYAKCDPEDEFDLAIGIAISTNRLQTKLAQRKAAEEIAYAKACHESIEWLKRELKRVTESRDRAEVKAADHRVEIAQLQNELEDLLDQV